MQEIQKRREEEQEKKEKLERMKAAEEQSRLVEDKTATTGGEKSWNVRPKENIPDRSSKSKTLGFLWFGIIALWGAYVIFS